MDINQLAQLVDQAAATATPIAQLSQQYTFNEAEAYDIQTASINRRYDRGESFIGLKLGFTSRAKMEQMGVHDMIWGRLTSTMLCDEGKVFMDRHIHPRAEPEICFLVGKDIDHHLNREELSDYITGIAPAIEIIDSRYQNFKFSLEDVIADNCSSSGLIIGQWEEDIHTPIDNLAIEMLFDGEVVQSGNSKAILGDPWESVIAASRLASAYGQPIPKGSYLMAGAATPAMYLKAGMKVEVRVEKLGTVSLEVV